MPTTTRTVTELLTAYRDGTLPREAMLEAVRVFPWKAVKKGDARSDSAWENEPYPQVGTVQEVYAAEAAGLISAGDSDAICAVIRDRSA